MSKKKVGGQKAKLSRVAYREAMRLKKEKGWSNEQLAKHLGVTPNTIYNTANRYKK